MRGYGPPFFLASSSVTWVKAPNTIDEEALDRVRALNENGYREQDASATTARPLADGLAPGKAVGRADGVARLARFLGPGPWGPV